MADWVFWSRRKPAFRMPFLKVTARSAARRMSRRVASSRGIDRFSAAQDRLSSYPVSVLHLRSLLEVLIVVDAKNAGGKIGIKKQSTGFRGKETRACMTGHHERRQAFVVCQI